MSIKDKIWLKRFCLALLGFCLYLFDTGSDTAVGYILIQNCHKRFGAAVLCLVYVLPGLFVWLNETFHHDNQDKSFTLRFFGGLLFCVFFVPYAVFTLIANLITLDDEWLSHSKR